MSFDDMGTGEGRRAPAQLRDIPRPSKALFDLILELQAQHYAAEGLTYALVSVIDDLVETPS